MSNTSSIGLRSLPTAGQRVVVYGLGLSGLAATRLLRARGVEVLGIDGRRAEDFDAARLRALREDAGVILQLGTDPDAAVTPGLLEGAVAVVTSPGIAPDRPLLSGARERGLPVVAEVELAYRHMSSADASTSDVSKVDTSTTGGDVAIGITGSNGKSTTAAMTGALLRTAGVDAVACGNLGPPYADAVVDAAGEVRTYVVELSSFQLETIDQFRPRAAALLNLSRDHIDRHGSFAAYRHAKAAVFRNQEADDVAVLNADDPRVAVLPVPGRRRLFSRRGPVPDGCYLAGDRVLEVVPGAPEAELFRVADVAVEGTHNLENAMAAALLARSQSASAARIREGLRQFRGLPHRLQHVTKRDGVTWFDDSKGTNVGATLASLEGFADGSVHLILGGRGKNADFVPLMPMVARKALRLYLIGEAANALAAAADAIAPSVPVEQAATLARAVTLAARRAAAGEAVLLSPACASFDQFQSFIDRGETFQRLVHGLGTKEAKHGA